METNFIAPDIECDGCAASIGKALGRQPGVEAVAVDVDARTVLVRHDEALTDPTELAALLDAIGFPTQRPLY